MKLLITGSNGLLGQNLVGYFRTKPGWQVFGTSLNPADLSEGVEFTAGDLADADFAFNLIRDIQPDVVINTVALVDLERCEHEPQTAWRANVITAENLANALGETAAKLIHISTDHLFSGTHAFYSEDEPPGPVNNYGRTKLAAEKVCLAGHDNTAVIRTNFYGWSRGAHRPTFGEWMYRSLRDQAPIKLFSNYFYTPIEVDYLMPALEMVTKSDFVGILNIAGTERCSKYEFGAAMAAVLGFGLANVTMIEMDPTSFAVPRQADLSLSTEKFTRLFDLPLPGLKEGLMEFKKTKPGGGVEA